MACNLKVITCYYMHYMPLHAPQDANEDLLLQAAAQHRTPLISPISLQSKTKLGFNFVEQLWYGTRSWPQSQSERGKSNLE